MFWINSLGTQCTDNDLDNTLKNGDPEAAQKARIDQSSPLFNTYSPRLYGAPPQLTHFCDMRLKSSDGTNPGPVGDFYLEKVLRPAMVANIVVGRALFTGGHVPWYQVLVKAIQYAEALKRYDVFDRGSNRVISSSNSNSIANKIINYATSKDVYDAAFEEQNSSTFSVISAEQAGIIDVDGDISVVNMYDTGNAKSLMSYFDAIFSSANPDEVDISIVEDETETDENGEPVKKKGFLTKLYEVITGAVKKAAGVDTGGGVSGLSTIMLTSLSVQQPFYTFESDWFSYANNLKMMMNTATIMLGLQQACVRIGDYMYPIGLDVSLRKDTDVWSMYRYITASTGLGVVTALDTMNGDTTQYLSYMIDPVNITESYTNTTKKSQLKSSVLDMGEGVGTEIAFLTNSSPNTIDDTVIDLIQGTTNLASGILSNLTFGVGRFTAAVASSAARSFVGDHTVYPEIFESHSSQQQFTITTTFTARDGSAYSQLLDCLLPMFSCLCLSLPQLSNNTAAAYTFPPLVQINVPGLFGSRLAMLETLSIVKNPNNEPTCVNGYPSAIKVTMQFKDLETKLYTSPMNKRSVMLNNNSMYDYIAQCAGVDKYRVNSAARLVTKLALSASSVRNTFYDLGSAMLTDITSTLNRVTGLGQVR